MKKDAKKKDSKPDTKVKDKPDTKVKDKPDTKVKDKPDTKVKDNADIKVKDKPDTKVKNKEDIESSASKNEPQKTFSNGEPAKTLDRIKKVFECFVCEKFRNEKIRIRCRDKNGITLYSISKPKKDYKIVHDISIYIDMLSLNVEKVTNSMRQDRSICVEDKKILLKISQTEKDSENQKKLDISIHNDKIISNVSITNKNFTKDVSMEIKYKNLFKTIKPCFYT